MEGDTGDLGVVPAGCMNREPGSLEGCDNMGADETTSAGYEDALHQNVPSALIRPRRRGMRIRYGMGNS